MNSVQYEELCRRFISETFGVPLDDVTSPRIPNPQRPDMTGYVHQIDHYWEVSSDVARYLHIANAKWRSSDKVDQADVLLLEQVRQKVAAHKALLITPIGFTSGANAVAQDDGIGLHVVRPSFDFGEIPTGDRAAIQTALAQVEGQLFSHQVVHRAADRPAQPAPGSLPHAACETRQSTDYTTRTGPNPGVADRGFGGSSGFQRPGGGGTGPHRGGGGLERR